MYACMRQSVIADLFRTVFFYAPHHFEGCENGHFKSGVRRQFAFVLCVFYTKHSDAQRDARRRVGVRRTSFIVGLCTAYGTRWDSNGVIERNVI